MEPEPKVDHIEQLPVELMSLALASLPRAADLLNARAVCRRWRDTAGEQHAAWQRFLFEACPFPFSWKRFGRVAAGSSLQCFLRLHRQKSRLAATWTESYRKGFSTGKYSRWVCEIETPEFVLPLLFAVRIFGLCLPRGFSTLDGAPQRQYDKEHSTSAHAGGGGWKISDTDLEQLELIGKDAFLGLQIFHDVEPGDLPRRLHALHGYGHGGAREGVIDEHLRTWWGGARRDELLAELFDAEALVALTEFVLEDVAKGRHGCRLDSLFWDVQGIVVRGVENVAAATWPEFPITMEFPMFGDEPCWVNSRQVPPFFNLAKLSEEVERIRRRADKGLEHAV